MQTLSAEVKALDTELAEIDAKLTEFTLPFQTSLLIVSLLEQMGMTMLRFVVGEHRANLALNQKLTGI